MKTIITTLLLAFIVSACQAQNKPVTAPTPAAIPKPTYTIDTSKPFMLGGKLTIQQVNDFLVVLQFGLPAIESHPSLTGAQITVMKKNYQTVADTISTRFNKYLEADKAKFTADTAKQFHPKK